MRHLLTISGVTDDDLATIYDLALAPLDDSLLAGQGVALVFELASLRTRASSATAVHELGGYATFFSDAEIGLGTRESVADVARTLSELFALCALRVRKHEVFEAMRVATDDRMALINLLSPGAHPTQAIADVLTLAEHFGNGDVSSLRGRTVAYVGDATNVTRSLAVALARVGVNVHVGAPTAYQLTPDGDENALADFGPGSGAVRLFDNAVDAVRGADAVYTDTWISMGDEAEAEQRRRDLASFQVNDELLAHAAPNAVVLHCLPAHRGEEVTDDVLDSERSLIWRQVQHRRSAMVGVLRWIKEEA
jgi:ornithine carbamoyltransferase